MLYLSLEDGFRPLSIYKEANTKDRLIKEINLKLKAPLVAMERVAKGQYLSKVFAEVALDELRIAQKLVGDLQRKRKDKHV